MTERELFLEWHYNQYLSENPNIDLSNAKYIYDYAHTHAMVGSIRENLFIAWQAATKREGFKFVPTEPTDRMLDAARRRQWDELSSPLEDMDMLKYKAMIGAIDE